MTAALTAANAPAARLANAGLFIATGLLVGAWATQIPQLLKTHGIGESLMGVLILIVGLGAIAAMLFSGHAIARLGSRKVMIVAGIAMIPVLPFVALAPNLWLLAGAAAFFGAAMGTMDVAMNANALEVEQTLERPIMSSAHGFWSLGGFWGGIGGAYVIKHTSSPTQALLAALAIALIVLVSLPKARGFAPSAAPSPKTAPHAPKRAAAVPKIIWLLGFMALCSFIPEGAVIDWAAIFLVEAYSADEFSAGLGFAFYSATMALTRFAGDPIRARLGAVKTLYISGSIAVAGLLLAALAPNLTLSITGFTIAGLGAANMVPLIFAAAGNTPGTDPSRAIAAVTIFGYTGVLVAPASIGFVGEMIGFSATFVAIALLTALVTVLGRATAAADAGNGH